ncbi:Hypothetical protein A7982_04445 [Minicystis rosea]|nr:Hypothetical protein A7982_04445 [Minicystis rosea]
MAQAARSLEAPDPVKIAAALREQLEQLEQLIEAFPGVSAFALAAENIEAAIGQLDPETYVTG